MFALLGLEALFDKSPKFFSREDREKIRQEKIVEFVDNDPPPEVLEAFLRAVAVLHKKESSTILSFLKESRDELKDTHEEIQNEQSALRDTSDLLASKRLYGTEDYSAENYHDKIAVDNYLKARNAKEIDKLSGLVFDDDKKKKKKDKKKDDKKKDLLGGFDLGLDSDSETKSKSKKDKKKDKKSKDSDALDVLELEEDVSEKKRKKKSSSPMLAFAESPEPVFMVEDEKKSSKKSKKDKKSKTIDLDLDSDPGSAVDVTEKKHKKKAKEKDAFERDWSRQSVSPEPIFTVEDEAGGKKKSKRPKSHDPEPAKSPEPALLQASIDEVPDLDLLAKDTKDTDVPLNSPKHKKNKKSKHKDDIEEVGFEETGEKEKKKDKKDKSKKDKDKKKNKDKEESLDLDLVPEKTLDSDAQENDDEKAKKKKKDKKDKKDKKKHDDDSGGKDNKKSKKNKDKDKEAETSEAIDDSIDGKKKHKEKKKGAKEALSADKAADDQWASPREDEKVAVPQVDEQVKQERRKAREAARERLTLQSAMSTSSSPAQDGEPPADLHEVSKSVMSSYLDGASSVLDDQRQQQAALLQRMRSRQDQQKEAMEVMGQVQQAQQAEDKEKQLYQRKLKERMQAKMRAASSMSQTLAEEPEEEDDELPSVHKAKERKPDTSETPISWAGSEVQDDLPGGKKKKKKKKDKHQMPVRVIKENQNPFSNYDSDSNSKSPPSDSMDTAKKKKHKDK